MGGYSIRTVNISWFSEGGGGGGGEIKKTAIRLQRYPVSSATQISSRNQEPGPADLNV